jgi:hypothetical protein
MERDREKDRKHHKHSKDHKDQKEHKEHKKEKKHRKNDDYSDDEEVDKKHHKRKHGRHGSDDDSDNNNNNDVSDEERDHERSKRKAAKKAEKVAKLLGYSNDVNPFGDSNLMQPFMWGKKVEQTKAKGGSNSREEDDPNKRLELMEEINRVRKRRDDREKEMEEMERLRNEEQRLREAAQYGDWERKEEEFHLQQTRVRSKIRISDMREQPIDLLAKNIILIESAMAAGTHNIKDHTVDYENLDVELRDPVSVIESLDSLAVDQLVDDISSYLQLSTKNNDGYEQFWSSLQFIVNRKRELQRQKMSSSIHRSMQQEVDALLGNKNDRELELLEADIRRGITEGKYPDVNYWENIANEIALNRAKSYVTSVHKELLKKQLDILSKLREKMRESGELGADEDFSSLQRQRKMAKYSSSSSANAEDQALQQEAERMFGSGENEENMATNDEVMLPGETYWWQDKHRPRKPRYFNKVRTGWDWNKYNATHYDYDNPPPKTIQGYKFAIFYPDLMDKDKTPKYFLEPCEDKEFAILRFHAGPPYEDIAFKVLNKQWDIHRKSGFKCVFERGILQLHFNFKRQWYRR